jgi:hypothetical protein
MEPGPELPNRLALAGTLPRAGLTEMPVLLFDSRGPLGLQVPLALLEWFERVRSHRQTNTQVPAPIPKWLPRLRACASKALPFPR